MRDLYRKAGKQVWYGQYKTIEGRRRQVCLHTNDRSEAVRRLRAKSSATKTARDTQPHPLKDALQWLVDHGCSDKSAATVRMYSQRSGQILRLLGDVDVNDLTRDDLQSFIDKRLKEKASRETIRKEMVTIKRALELARERCLFFGTLEVLPRFRARYVPKKIWLSPEQFDQLLEKKNLPEKRKRWILVACNMGGRLSEVEGLEWTDVDLKEGWLHVRGTKTTKSDRWVPISSPLRELLEAVEDKKRRGLVVGTWPNVRRSLRRHCTTLGIPVVGPNGLRKTFASWLKQKGVDSSVVARLMGHTTSRMVDLVYGSLADKNLVDAIGQLPSGNNTVTENSLRKEKEPKALKAVGS
jgi:integrase